MRTLLLAVFLLLSGCMDWDVDWDHDGYLPASMTAADEEFDCDNHDNNVHPGAPELCNQIDDDCDGDVDEDAADATTWYFDDDEDGYGVETDTQVACEDPGPEWTDLATPDCAPQDPSINPGAEELCNDIDDDCDDAIGEGIETREWFLDADGDGGTEQIGVVLGSDASSLGLYAQGRGDAFVQAVASVLAARVSEEAAAQWSELVSAVGDAALVVQVVEGTWTLSQAGALGLDRATATTLLGEQRGSAVGAGPFDVSRCWLADGSGFVVGEGRRARLTGQPEVKLTRGTPSGGADLIDWLAARRADISASHLGVAMAMLEVEGPAWSLTRSDLLDQPLLVYVFEVER